MVAQERLCAAQEPSLIAGLKIKIVTPKKDNKEIALLSLYRYDSAIITDSVIK